MLLQNEEMAQPLGLDGTYRPPALPGVPAPLNTLIAACVQVRRFASEFLKTSFASDFSLSSLRCVALIDKLAPAVPVLACPYAGPASLGLQRTVFLLS